MQITRISFGLCVVAIACFVMTGCENKSTQDTSKKKTTSPPKIAHDDDHGSHDDHDDHDHGDHGHPSEGPHHGHLIELGKEEYHAELLHDDDTSTITIYILDSSAKKEVPVAEDAVTLNMMIDGKPSQFKMTAKPSATDAEGQASHFEVVDKKLLDALEGEEAKGRLNVTINGKPFVGTIEHHGHDDHDHKH